MPNTEGLQSFVYLYSYLNLNKLFFVDHEAFIESLSGLFRWQN